MSLEDQHTDRKSLRTVSGKTADWEALAKDCVCFANGAGGRLLLGIEDGEELPPAAQTAPPISFGSDTLELNQRFERGEPNGRDVWR